MPTSPPVDHFPDRNELKRFLRTFLRERTNSLKKDVEHCLSGNLAPFPALLYCVSVVDLLGALVAGQAKKVDPATGNRVNTTGNSKSYMKNFMKYTDQQIDFIMEIFRHKMVHLAQPQPVLKYGTKTVSWIYYHANQEKHLLLEDAPIGSHLIIKSDWKIQIDQYFNMSILNFMHDILESVEGHGGFFDRLQNDTIFQDTVKKALQEIYE